MKYVLLVLTLIALTAGPAVASVPEDLQRVSVTIKAGNAQGSGTLVTRKIGDDTVTFIWTAAHVVDGLRATRTVVTPQGTPRILVEYRDAEIVQERQQDGRRRFIGVLERKPRGRQPAGLSQFFNHRIIFAQRQQHVGARNQRRIDGPA